MHDMSTVIREVYAAALDENPWQDVIAGIATKSFQASGAFMFTTFVPPSEGGLGVFHGLPEALVKAFLAETASVDIWYQELVRRHGPLRCLSTIVGDGSSDSTPLMPLCLYRPVGSKPFSKAEQASLRMLQPHLTQAMQVRRKLNTARRGAAELAVDRVSTAVVVLARDRTILLANPAAEDLFGRPGTSLVRDRRLCARSQAQMAALEKALLACSTYRFDGTLSLSVRLSGPQGAGVVARIVPPPATTPLAGRAAAIAFLMVEGTSQVDLEAIVTMLYSLSPAETRLIKALSDGATLEEFADSRSVGIATVKSQLRSVFAKTGTNRQADLMRLLYSIAR